MNAARTTSAPTTPYGPAAHNAWVRESDGVSLVRRALAPNPVRFDAQGQGVTIDIARSVLVVVDMQNDFCHPQGWFGQKGLSVKPMRRPIALLARLLPAWRAAGGTVLWLNWGIRPDRLNLPPVVQFKGRRGAGVAAAACAAADSVGYAETSSLDRGRSLVAGDWGAQVVDELAVAPQDITVHKHRLSGFWDNELDSVLRLRGCTTLLFGGVNTDRCVFGTLQDAAFLGYDCVLLKDACSTPSPAYVSRAIHFIVQQLHGFVASGESLLAALPAASAPEPALSPATPAPRTARRRRVSPAHP